MPITDFYVVTDALGSPLAILDEDGNILERRCYDAFGGMNCLLPDGTMASASPTGVDVGFSGQIRDEITGLYQMGYRWYHPAMARWLSRDPLGEAGGLNEYRYASNDPLTSVDPFGLWQCTIYGGDGLVGYLTFGNNGGRGAGSWVNGQWNIGVRAGGGFGFSISADAGDSGRQSPGWSGNFPTYAATVGAGVLGASAETGVNHGTTDVGNPATNPYVSLGVRAFAFSKNWAGGIKIDQPDGPYASFSQGVSNYGASFFIGGGFAWTSR